MGPARARNKHSSAWYWQESSKKKCRPSNSRWQELNLPIMLNFTLFQSALGDGAPTSAVLEGDESSEFPQVAIFVRQVEPVARGSGQHVFSPVFDSTKDVEQFSRKV